MEENTETVNPNANAHSPKSEPGASHEAHEAHEAHHDHVRDLFTIYVWLMVLLGLTVLTALWPKLHFGELNIVIAMSIAVTKAAMVVWIFMHVKYGGKLVWVFASAAFVWLAIMFVITFSDYGTRDKLPRGEPFPSLPTPEQKPRATGEGLESEQRH